MSMRPYRVAELTQENCTKAVCAFANLGDPLCSGPCVGALVDDESGLGVFGCSGHLIEDFAAVCELRIVRFGVPE